MRIILTALSGLEKFDSSDHYNDVYPLGLLYIQSYLESKNHEVKYLNFWFSTFEDSKKDIIDEINIFHPDVIGFSFLTDTRSNTFKMIEYVHDRYPEVKIVIGGIHVTVMYEQILRKYPYVIAIIGEGEITFGELLDDRPLGSIKGVAFCLNGTVVKTDNRELCDLDSLPFPKHHIHPKQTQVNIMTSRGCPSACSFCVLNPNVKRIQRFRSAKNVVDEIEVIVNKYEHIKSVYFIDDAFLTNNKRAIEICNEIIKRGLNKIEFSCQARFKPFHKEIIPYLECANFKLIAFGLETANEPMLKRCHKSITQQDAIDVITMLKDSNIIVNVYLLVGLPGETRETIIETVNFFHTLQKIKYIMHYDSNPGILVTYPGTEVYEMMKSSGKITDDYWLTDNSTPVYSMEHSLEELTEFRNYLAKRTAFMPPSLTKLYYQIDFIIPIFKYAIKHYKAKPLTLFKIIFRSI